MFEHKVIGVFAFLSPTEVLCDGVACLIMGSEEKFRKHVIELKLEDLDNHTIKKTRFGEIMKGIELGAEYCFDEEAYNRFYPLAGRNGLNLGPKDFSKTPFVTVLKPKDSFISKKSSRSLVKKYK